MNSTIGELITTLRSKNRMSQKDLADYLYVNQGTVSRWERGVRFPDTELIEKMATLFGVDASVLIQAPLNRAEKPDILVVDDEPILLGDVAETVGKAIPESTVRPFRWASDALAYAEKHGIGQDVNRPGDITKGEAASILADADRVFGGRQGE